MEDKSSTATSKELSQWKRSFKVFFYGTPIIVIAFFIVQICATKGSFSTEFNSLDNWKTFTDTFNLPIGVFTAMAAITTLIGMYYRSLQLAHQLNKVEDQIEIANKQFSKSSEQFELAQKQFSLASRKENYVLYLEHSKQIHEELKERINFGNSYHFPKGGALGNLNLEFRKFYEYCFPENTYQGVYTFEHKAQTMNFEQKFKEYQAHLEELIPQVEKRLINGYELYASINRSLFDVGLSYLPNQRLKNKDDTRELLLESFKLLPFIYTLLDSYNLVDEKTAKNCTAACEKLEAVYIGHFS